MSFDDQPDGDPHGECALEIKRLESELAAMTAERDELLRGEFICQRCGLRKNGEFEKGDFDVAF